MNIFFRIIMQHNAQIIEISYTLIRVIVGGVFLMFGCNKFMAGTAHAAQLGSVMAAFGITRDYMIWGYLAALTEFCGGLAYIFGFCTRIASLPLVWLLFVAIHFHINKGDSCTVWAFPFVLFVIAISFLIGGSGLYSIDTCLTR